MTKTTKTLKMELFSRLRLDADSSARQIMALSEFEHGLLRPNKCDTSEPPREIFNAHDISEPVRWLSQPSAYFQFRQSKPFHIEGFIHNRMRGQVWTRDRKGGPLIPVVPKFPEPLFITHWVIWFGRKLAESKGLDVIIRFVKEAFLISRSEYGYLALEEDQRSKNFLVTEKEGITATEFVGNDPEYGLPGLYWLNVLGPTYTKWLGTALTQIPANSEALAGDSILIQFGESPDSWQSEEIRLAQQSTVASLGREKFFDISDPERLLQTPFSPSARGNPGKDETFSRF